MSKVLLLCILASVAIPAPFYYLAWRIARRLYGEFRDRFLRDCPYGRRPKSDEAATSFWNKAKYLRFFPPLDPEMCADYAVCLIGMATKYQAEGRRFEQAEKYAVKYFHLVKKENRYRAVILFQNLADLAREKGSEADYYLFKKKIVQLLDKGA